MKITMKSAVTILVCALLAASSASAALWDRDGSAVCIAVNNQEAHVSVSDGVGGSVIAWQDYRSGAYDIYAQRVDAWGNPLWSAGGVAVCGAAGQQMNAAIVSDGAGGAIIAWQDSRSGNYDIYAQHIDASGDPLWPANGVAVCTEANDQRYPKVVGSILGGSVVVWEDFRYGANWDIYIQRLDADGNSEWRANGDSVSTAAGHQLNASVVEFAYGALVAWQDSRSGNWDIYLTSVYYDGMHGFGGEFQVCTATNNQLYPSIAYDGDGGILVAWQDRRNGSNYDIYAQYINEMGAVWWTSGGEAICTAAGNQESPKIAADGSYGACITWVDRRSGSDYDVYGQRVDVDGDALWDADGMAICEEAGDQLYHTMINDESWGMIVAWEDHRDGAGYDVYVQHIDVWGNAQWDAGGVALGPDDAVQYRPSVVIDVAGGAVVSWYDTRNGDRDIFAQRIDRHGYWGLPAPEIKAVHDISGDEGGYVNVCWNASRLEPWPLQLITHYTVWRGIRAGGELLARAGGPPAAGAVLHEGIGTVHGGGELPTGGEAFTHSEGPPAAGAVLPGNAMTANAGITFLNGACTAEIGPEDLYWELVATQQSNFYEHYARVVRTVFDSTGVCTENHYFRVIAHTADPGTFWISAPDSGYSVDNLAPAMPGGLDGEGSHEPEGLTLSWHPNTEVDLAHYAVYRGTTEDFTPAPGNRIASPADTLYFDDEWTWGSAYYYKVAAIDIHGNESLFALLRPEDIAGGETPETPIAPFLSQNFPNPFNPATTIVFGLDTAVHVGLKVYDASGRLVRTLVGERREAGRHEEVWDGKDDGGRAVASGVYFYRLTAGRFTSTRKMVLFR